MPNTRIKGIQDNIWVEYSMECGELDIICIYLNNDKERTDLFDYMSYSVINKALDSARQDWDESYWDRLDALKEQMLEMSIISD